MRSKLLDILIEECVPLEDVIEFLRDRVEDNLIITNLEWLLSEHEDDMIQEWSWLESAMKIHED